MSVELSNYGKVGDDQSAELSSVIGALLQYWSKFKGVEGKTFPPQKSYIEMNVSFLLSFVGILMLSALDRWFLIRFFTYDEGDQFTVTMLTAVYAASAVLLFDAPTSPLAQPWNCILGHTISALLGVLIRMAGFSVGAEVWVIAPIAVAASIFLMNVLECTHPPAAGTAMIATVGGPKIWALGNPNAMYKWGFKTFST
jgi:CBS-domain-containing membrane protein